MSFFESLEMKPDDPILGLAQSFAKDPRETKVNLGIGAYKTSDGKPLVLSCVRKAETLLLNQNLNKEYLPILGSQKYIDASLKLIFGSLESNAFAAAQTIGGTGALRLGGDFLYQNQISPAIYLSDPTWPNHQGIFTRSGLKIEKYPYYDFTSHSFDFEGLCAFIKKIPPRSTILLQPCCHNPSGIDPTFEQWKELSNLIQKHKLIPFFDLAYLGFSQGADVDANVIRYFVEKGHEIMVSLSYSKNFGLYGERVGLLAFAVKDSDKAMRINSHMKQIIRGSYSMPPLQGQRIVTTILENESLSREWIQELDSMRKRIEEMRKALISGLKEKRGNGTFDFLKKQIGMFSFSGLNNGQVETLQKEYGIFLPANGRINVAGLNDQNVKYVINSICSVL